MVAFPLKVRGLNTLLVVFSLLVLGGSAYVMSTNQTVNYKSGASNVTETATGVLVKKGSAAFAPCGKVNATVNYGLLGASCTPLSIKSSLADPVVGKKVVVTGTMQNGIFYATTLKLQK